MYEREFGRMMDGHLDPDVVSDLVGGLLTEAEAASVQRHLAECAECHELRASLAEVRQLLAALPAEPMPGKVAKRIDKALAAESTLRAAGPDAQPRATQRPVRALDSVRGRRAEGGSRRLRMPALAQLAAAFAVLVSGSVLGLTVIGSLRDDDRSTESSTAGSTAGNTAGNTAGSTADQGAPSAEAGAAQQPLQVTRSGTEYSRQTLVAKAGPLAAATSIDVNKVPAGSAPARSGAENDANRKSLTSKATQAPVPPCVLAATGRPGVVPLAADLGTYDGAPAAVLVLPLADRAERVDVFVVSTACAANGEPSGQVLDRRQISRPTR